MELTKMTPEQIDQLQPGLELDALIEEKIMEYTVDKTSPYWAMRLGNYSTEIAAAWLVVEKLESEGKLLILSNANRHIDEKKWKAALYLNLTKPVDHLHPIEGANGDGETPALAICRAALKTIGGKE